MVFVLRQIQEKCRELNMGIYAALTEKRTVLLISASMAPSSMQWSTLLSWAVSSPMMPQSARILMTTCSKPAVPLEECPRGYGSHLLCLSMKIQVYRAIIIPTLLYGAETWVLYRKQIRLLGRVHQRRFRSIRGMEWQDYVSDEEVRKKAACQAWIPSCFRCSCAWLGTSQGRKTHACPNQSSSASSKTEIVIVEFQESVTKTS